MKKTKSSKVITLEHLLNQVRHQELIDEARKNKIEIKNENKNILLF